jgi:hypothetical protein
MSRIRSQLRFGLWPDSPTPALHSTGLTFAARRLAESALEELARDGVTAALDEAGRARFSPTKVSSRDARRVIEIQGDLIEALLVERALRLGPP